MKVEIGQYDDDGVERTISVHIDKWDTWNVDTTLAHIIAPLLKKFKETAQTYPNDLTKEQWDEIIDDMIFAFETKSEQFDALNACNTKCAEVGSEICQECMRETQDRMTRGFAAFGKYYENLWD